MSTEGAATITVSMTNGRVESVTSAATNGESGLQLCGAPPGCSEADERLSRIGTSQRYHSKMRILVGSLVSVLGLCLCEAPATAQEVTVLSSNGIRAVLTALAPEFERATNHKLVITYSVSAELKRRIEEGARFDVTILTPTLIDDLAGLRKVVPESRTPLARSGMALGVRAGALRPDIRTTAALTSALRDAPSIAFAKEGAGGVFFAALLPRLGLTEVLAPKLRPFTTGTDVSAAIARGDAALGLLPLSELISASGVDVVGPFPADVQGYAVMVAAIGASATQPEAGGALVRFLAAADKDGVLAKHGMSRVP